MGFLCFGLGKFGFDLIVFLIMIIGKVWVKFELLGLVLLYGIDFLGFFVVMMF